MKRRLPQIFLMAAFLWLLNFPQFLSVIKNRNNKQKDNGLNDKSPHRKGKKISYFHFRQKTPYINWEKKQEGYCDQRYGLYGPSFVKKYKMYYCCRKEQIQQESENMADYQFSNFKIRNFCDFKVSSEKFQKWVIENFIFQNPHRNKSQNSCKNQYPIKNFHF